MRFSDQRGRLLAGWCLVAVLPAATPFSGSASSRPASLVSPFLASKNRKRSRPGIGLRMIDDDSSVLDNELLSSPLSTDDLLHDSVLFEELASSSAGPMLGETQHIASDLVANALQDEAVTAFLDEGAGVATQLPGGKMDQDAMLASETVSAILAASEEATLAAQAALPKEVAQSVPLIPVSPGNDTMPSFAEGQLVPDAKTMAPSIVPSSEVVGEPATAIPEQIDAPSVRKILKFAIPAVGVWLCSPLLSLIDTSAVGLLSGTAQQAALNPAVAVTDYAALLIAFMYTGTTNLVAAAREKDRGVEGKPRTTKNLIGALQLSGFVGAALGTILFVFARSLLRAIIGNDAINPEIFSAAMKYVRIRALGMPAAAIIGSSQAACLGMQDIKSPLYVLAAAAIVNFFGDVIFVGHSHPWLGGAAGAAWATVFSQFAAVALFVHWLCHKPNPRPKPKVVNLTDSIKELMGEPTSKGQSRREKFRDDIRSLGKSRVSMSASVTRKVSSLVNRLPSRKSKKSKEFDSPKTKEEPFSTRGFLDGKFSGRDFLKLPSKDMLSDFAPYVVPVTSTQVGRVSGYVAMSHVVSSSLGTVGMAAQQVIVSLFYCLCPIADSLSLTAQSFLPSIVEKRVSRARASALRRSIRNFWKAGGVFGIGMMGAVMTIPIVSRFFTSDPAVVALVNSAAPLLLAFFSVHGILCATEGTLLGQKDLGFLGKAYAAYFVAVPALMLRVKRAAFSGANVGLKSVWEVFLGYQLFRTVVWVLRTMQLQRRTERSVQIAEASEI